MAICRQRPGTAKGHCFISLEDETGIANLFVPKNTFHQFRQTIVTEPFLFVTGKVQRLQSGKPTVYVTTVSPYPAFSPDHAVTSLSISIRRPQDLSMEVSNQADR